MKQIKEVIAMQEVDPLFPTPDYIEKQKERDIVYYYTINKIVFGPIDTFKKMKEIVEKIGIEDKKIVKIYKCSSFNQVGTLESLLNYGEDVTKLFI